MIQNTPYNASKQPETTLARQRSPLQERETFGKNLTQFRKAAGFSQESLAREIGVTQRIIAHYERAKGNPPLYLLPRLAKALAVTVHQLLGLQKVKLERKDNRLRRRTAEIEKLPVPVRKQVSQYMDTVLQAWKSQHGKE